MATKFEKNQLAELLDFDVAASALAVYLYWGSITPLKNTAFRINPDRVVLIGIDKMLCVSTKEYLLVTRMVILVEQCVLHTEMTART